MSVKKLQLFDEIDRPFDVGLENIKVDNFYTPIGIEPLDIRRTGVFDINVLPPRPLDVGLETNYYNSWQQQFSPVINDFDFQIPNAVIDPVFQTFTPQTTAAPTTAAKYFSGKIVDEMGVTIPYATINSVNDNTIWTESDENGKYHISVPENHKVTISSVGYQAQTIQASQLGAEIVLKMDSANQLNEVVIIATKKDNTMLYAGLGVLAVGLVVFSSSSSSKLGAGKSTKKTKTPKSTKKGKGLNKNTGKLKKGFKYAKGGKIVKTKSKSALNAPAVKVTI